MKRRGLALSTAAALLGWPLRAWSQPATERIYRVGFLRPGATVAANEPQVVYFPRAFGELGYVEGRNLVIDVRYAHGDLQRLPELARSFVDERFDIVVAVGSPAARAMKAASATLPIVVYGNFDPLALGLVSSLARPGGNLTAVLMAPDGTLAGKRLQLLREVVPQATRIGLLVPEDPAVRVQLQETKQAASALRLELPVVVVRDGDYAAAFDDLARQRVAALVVASHQYFVTDRAAIIQLAARHKLPAMYEWREQVADGGLMTYSTSLYGIHQRVAAYVDRILKGANPGEIPVERPTKFEFVINLKTAKALGLALPQALLLRADEVIQ
jgi:putative tryptophan/tyrosine transport system substrate-binding protein